MSRLLELAPPGIRSAANSNFDGYLDRITKFVPSEVLTAFLFVDNLIRSSKPRYMAIIVVAGFFCINVAYLATRYQSRIKEGKNTVKQKWVHVVVSSVMFLVWTYAIGGSVYGDLHDPIIAAVILVFAALLSGLFEPSGPSLPAATLRPTKPISMSAPTISRQIAFQHLRFGPAFSSDGSRRSIERTIGA